MGKAARWLTVLPGVTMPGRASPDMLVSPIAAW
jgi:hypothetical protein